MPIKTKSLRSTPVLCILVASMALAACGDPVTEPEEKPAEQAPLVTINADPFPSTYQQAASSPTLIRNATVLDGNGNQLNSADVRLEDGKIKEIGVRLAAGENDMVVDASGKWVTPGIIDVHSHLGAGAQPGVTSQWNVNEGTDPVTSEVWVEHSVSSKDPGYIRARAGGVTALQILPGSANLFGGRSVVLKNVPSRTMQGMKFPGAPYGLKMACGENPKRVYKKKGGPATTMGNVAGYRTAWIKATEFKREWEKYTAEHEAGKDPKPPKRDLQLETLVGVLNGDILVHMHCYLADEMSVMIDVMKEFDYKITSFQHTVEAYKIRDILAENNICAAMWADWWGFKMESYDGIPENIAFVHEAGGCAIVHSDSDVGVQRLNQEAAKALASGQRAGVKATKADAWTWLSANPAKSLGIFDKTGSLDPGKAADVVVWSGDPFSTYTQAELVFVDGVLQFDRNNPATRPLSDFELGQHETGAAK